MKQSHKEVSDAPLVNTEEFVKVNICTKCGNAAVTGLCDMTLQGNMTKYEYFVSGSEPKESCDCHVAMTVCKATGHGISGYCPEEELKVYLYEGIEGTEDEAYVVPAEAGVKCEEHTNLIDKWFGEDGSSEEESEDEYTYQEEYGNGWESLLPWNW